MKRLAYILILSMIAQALIAQEQEKNIASSSELILQISSLPEAKLGFTQRFGFPFMQGQSPLTANNNIVLALTGEISPLSANILVETVWTPIAFFQLAAGGSLGSGWNIKLFGNEAYGIGLNQADSTGNKTISGSAFDGLLWKAQAGGAIQFDLAAIIPGDWNHVVFRSYHEINYRGYTRAKADESWYFEADDGENCNGFIYYGNILLGYQMPIFLNLIGFLTGMDLYLYDTAGRESWGDDLSHWIFTGILGFEITKKFSVTVLTQFVTQRNYNESNWKDLYYRNRTLDTNDKHHLEFYRVAAVLIYKF